MTEDGNYILFRLLQGKLTMKIKIKTEDIIKDIKGNLEDFPKYTTQLMNLANQNAQGTRPKVVGQMSELIQEFPDQKFQEWDKWYKQKMPEAIENATEKVNDMINKLKEAIGKIDKPLIKKWVEDLVVTKTFIGLRFQESILKRVSEVKKHSYRLATPDEEAKGIDGFIGSLPVSIKPITYKIKKMLRENIEVSLIYYSKQKDGIVVVFDF